MELYKIHHMYTLSDWLFMKEGLHIKGNELYRQKKSILEKLCETLPMMSTIGTKNNLITALQNYVFSDEQLNEMKCFQENKNILKRHEQRRIRINELIDTPRPYDLRTHVAIKFFEEDDAKLMNSNLASATLINII
jgi:hypothetical protein